MANTKKNQQLGMPYGTASNRLVKKLLLHMAQKLGTDVCFRCGGKIEQVAQFSIEHKEAWLDVSVELFWDLENVAFSHRKCNSAAGRRNVPALREHLNKIRVDHGTGAPEGEAWCYGHKAYRTRNLFNANRWFPSGVQRFCRECRTRGKGR